MVRDFALNNKQFQPVQVAVRKEKIIGALKMAINGYV